MALHPPEMAGKNIQPRCNYARSQPRGSNAIQCEFKRIQQLKLGFPRQMCWQFRKKAFYYRTLEYSIKARFSNWIKGLPPQGKSDAQFLLFTQAIQSIQSIHQKGGYLSEAFARNILVDEQNQFSFIDFETDPRDVLSLHDCFVRDWLLFIFSTAYHFEFEQLNAIAASHPPQSTACWAASL